MVEGSELTQGLLRYSGLTGRSEHIPGYWFDLLSCRKACDGMRRTLPGLRQIDASDQQFKHLPAKTDFRFSTGGFQPEEPPLLQPLGAEPEPTPGQERQLQAVVLRISEKENVPAQRIAAGPAPVLTGLQNLCACPSLRPPDKFLSGTPHLTRLRPAPAQKPVAEACRR